MEAVRVEGGPEPVGPYSQAVISNGLVFLSGQIPLKDGKLLKGDFKDQVRTVLENVKRILESAGSSMERVVKVTVYIKDMNLFGDLNEVYSEYFKKPYPARVVVEVRDLPKGADLEMDIIAER